VLADHASNLNLCSYLLDFIFTITRDNSVYVNIDYDGENVFGLIYHYDYKNETLLITDINNNQLVKKEDKVITRDIADQIHSSIYIGEVYKVENDDYGLSKEIRVKTSASLGDLNHVYVAKRDPKTLPDTESGDN